ncbi:hypothetical protein GCM10007902_31350 [Dyella nitratireducens]|nr:hypothetical protein GCM10007902_31350 [Dyella nitratireducens]
MHFETAQVKPNQAEYTPSNQPANQSAKQSHVVHCRNANKPRDNRKDHNTRDHPLAPDRLWTKLPTHSPPHGEHDHRY